jgi:hypothetical protein
MSQTSTSATKQWRDKLVDRTASGTFLRLRTYTAAAMLLCVCFEDFGSIALVSEPVYVPSGIIGRVEYVCPLFSELRTSAHIATMFQWWTTLWLAFALAGIATPFSHPVGTVSFLVLGGMIRNATFFFHLGMMPLYVACVLIGVPGILRIVGHCTRCSSLEHRDVVAKTWAVRTTWLVIGLVYFLAGASKLRNGGLAWMEADNFRRIVIQDTLNPMLFGFPYGLYLNDWPDWCVEAIAGFALISELAFAAIWFSRAARIVMPCVGLAMHASILLFQNVCFPDLILLQAVLIVEWCIMERSESVAESPRSPRMSDYIAEPAHLPTVAVSTSIGHVWAIGALLYVTVAVTLCEVWLFEIEYYPFTSWQMYSNADVSGCAEFIRIQAHGSDGQIVESRPEDLIGIMRDSRYRPMLRHAHGQEKRAAKMFAVCKETANGGDERNQVVSFSVEYYSWDFRAARAGRSAPVLIATRIYAEESVTTH